MSEFTPLVDGISGGYVRYEITSVSTDAQSKAVQAETRGCHSSTILLKLSRFCH